VPGENIEVLRSGYAAVNRGDIDALLPHIHPDVEFTSLVAEAEGQTFSGHDGVRLWWTEVVVPLGGLHGELEEVEEIGDAVVARVFGTYRPRGSRCARGCGTWSRSATARPRGGSSSVPRKRR
jgi:ketosteroid isomerase-like protein